MQKIIGLSVIVAGCAAVGGLTIAQDSDWYVKGGASYMKLGEDAEIQADGFPLPTAKVNTPDDLALNVELGRFITDNISLSASFNGVYTTENIGKGSLAGLGNLATDKFALIDFSANYQFNRDGRLQPYVGAGATWFYITNSDDKVLQDFFVDDTFGWHVKAGADYAINERWSVYAEAKQYFIETDAGGNLGPTAITGQATLDPVTVNAGVSFKF